MTAEQTDTSSAPRAGRVRFYLGTHQPGWLWRTDVPLFVSARRLAGRVLANLTPACGRWALDSGGFTELDLHGRWTVTPSEYVDQVSEWSARIGGLDFAAPQDWMCEPRITARTGLTVAEHQHRTVANLLELRRQAPGLPFVPVLQGRTVADYLACAELYRQAGIDLAAEALVGLGSVCRRQSTAEIGDITAEFAGLRLHGFGVKTLGLRRYGPYLASADSLAWSMQARRSTPLSGHGRRHRNCANCLTYALQWRERLLTAPPAPGAHQLHLALAIYPQEAS